jgi:hypothetical protein
MVRLSFTFIAVLCLSASAVGQQPPAMPKPGAEQKALARFAGTWKMEGTMEKSPMGPAGKFSGTETCRMFEGGWHLTCESSGTGPMGEMKGQALMSYDRSKKQYRYFAINNMPDAEMATGTMSATGSTWTSTMEMDGKTIHSRFLITDMTDKSYSFKWEMSTDGKSWNTVMQGKSTKVGA